MIALTTQLKGIFRLQRLYLRMWNFKSSHLRDLKELCTFWIGLSASKGKKNLPWHYVSESFFFFPRRFNVSGYVWRHALKTDPVCSPSIKSSLKYTQKEMYILYFTNNKGWGFVVFSHSQPDLTHLCLSLSLSHTHTHTHTHAGWMGKAWWLRSSCLFISALANGIELEQYLWTHWLWSAY